MTQQPQSRRVAVAVRSASFAEGVGGLERAVHDHIRGLTDAGWEVTLYAPGQFVRGTPRVTLNDVPWPAPRATPGKPGFGLAYSLWARRLARSLSSTSEHYDALYLHGGAAGALRWLAAERRPRRVVANPHGMEEFKQEGFLRWTNRVFTRHLARGARFADVVLATDQMLVPGIQRHLEVPPARIEVIPNAVDVRRLDSLAQAGAPVVGSPADIVSVGRLVHNKGYDILLDGLQILAEQGGTDHVLWRHFGDGDQYESLVMRAQSVTAVTLEVIRDADDAMVQANLRSGAIFVQPSRYEGSSLTTLEAMTHEAICVGTPVGGIPEKLMDGVTGFLAKEPTPEAIATALRRARTSPAAIGAAARRRVLDRYTLERLVHRLSRVLEDAPPVTDG